ncbi:hypothetical protein ABE354_24015 [Brevibacillus laterosporus]|uniref:hypothetical protein n=1 Tax=Brevibacillus laterosporus TaxID=1465 RepID=UPI003D20D6AA
MSRLKAYIARTTDRDQGADIVFSPTSNGAKNMAAGLYEGWVDYIDIRVNRAPQYDEYAEVGKVPKEVMLADGWSWECGDCLRSTYEERAVVINETVYCTDCRGGVTG